MGRDSELLVLDEPSANLDPEARHIFFQLLSEKRDTAAMLISSHRLDEVAALVNRVIEMDQGEVVLDDRVADLVEMSSRLYCRVALIRHDEAFARSIGEWGFVGSDGDRVWEGHVAGPDRLRFLGVLSRYAALLGGIRMDEAV
jgi:ABC-2 type transport system ATP-binding protein